jgi:SAM-dependent methyltransferase
MSRADLQQRSWQALIARASAPYAHSGRFAWHFARGKLRWDPVFRHLIVDGVIPPGARVLDIGCGQGLLASLLHAAAHEAGDGRWPAGWAASPANARVTGIELQPREVARARAALGDRADFVCADMRRVAFPGSDAVVILDALHYIEAAEQDEVLARARDALGGRGRLVLRVGDRAARGRFALGQWIDGIVAFLRGGAFRPRAGRTLGEWQACLAALGFQVSSRPMGRGTPFANVLLVGTVGVEVGAP